MSEFLVEDRDGTRRVPIGKQMAIGRSKGNELVLNAMFASRRHAWVWRQGDRFIIEDLSTTNGTYVNGRRLARPQFLNHNDVIMMGDGQLTFVAKWDASMEHTPPQGTPRVMASQVFCTRCGAPNHPQATACAHCGQVLGKKRGQKSEPAPARRSFTPTDPVMARPFPDTQVSPQLRTRGRSGAWMLVLLLGIIAVAFLTILAVLVFYVVS